MDSRPTPRFPAFSVAFALAAALAFGTADAAPPAAEDPLPGLLRRIEHYLRKNEVDGVTMDWRYAVSPSEEIRQTVVCQVLAYAELQRIKPSKRLRREIVEHADFLLGRLEDIRSHSPFDGMLAFALWSAFEATGEERFRDAALDVSTEMRAIPTEQCILNGGLMVAMGTAKEWELTGNAEALEKTHGILAGLAAYQNEDGSFPHWCHGSRDIHYTGWMAMELIHVDRLVDDPSIATYLARMNAFLEGRIGPDGRAVYESPCPWSPDDCTLYYWSRASGCEIDYDTRAWTVEPAYCALLFDRTESLQFAPVAHFLDELEDGGTLPDMYAYWPPPGDPEYPWTIADTSVVNMSVIFWALATAAAERRAAGRPFDLALDPPFDGPAGPADLSAIEAPDDDAHAGLAVAPNPARASCRFTFTLATPADVRLELVDARGRRVRTLVGSRLAAGPHSIAWDTCDDAGRRVGRGIYFARLFTPGAEAGETAERRVIVAP